MHRHCDENDNISLISCSWMLSADKDAGFKINLILGPKCQQMRKSRLSGGPWNMSTILQFSFMKHMVGAERERKEPLPGYLFISQWLLIGIIPQLYIKSVVCAKSHANTSCQFHAMPLHLTGLKVDFCGADLLKLMLSSDDANWILAIQYLTPHYYQHSPVMYLSFRPHTQMQAHSKSACYLLFPARYCSLSSVDTGLEVLSIILFKKSNKKRTTKKVQVIGS